MTEITPAKQQNQHFPATTTSFTAKILFLFSIILCVLGYALQPELETNNITEKSLSELIPRSFSGWHEVKVNIPHVDTVASGDLSERQPYDAQILRTYRNSAGDTVFLAIAYGRNQRQEIKVHRPEVCYGSVGWKVGDIHPINFQLTSSDGTQVSGIRMLAKHERHTRIEAVSYWIRIGHIFSQSGLRQRLHILWEGLQGRRSDGVLVRFSQLLPPGGNSSIAFATQEKFATELLQAMPSAGRALLIN